MLTVAMGELAAVLRFRAVLLRRWLVQHAFALFVLAPVPLGGALWVTARYLPLLRDDLAPKLLGGGALVLVALASAVLLPAALAELFPHRSADQLLDYLPISEANRLNGALAGLLVRSVPLALLLMALTYWLAEQTLSVERWVVLAGWSLIALWSLSPALLGLALSIAAWRCAGRRRQRLLVIVAVGFGGLLWAFGGSQITGLLKAPWLPAAEVLESVFREALEGGARPRPLGALAVAAGIPYLLCLAAASIWRRRLLQGARQAAGDFGAGLASWSTALMSPPLGVQVRRDLLQVLRRFSPAVGLAFGASFSILALAWAVLSQSALEPFLRGRLALLAGAAAVLPTSGLATLLLARQQPRFWIERSSGVERRLVWQAKLWSARLLALPAVAGGGMLVLASRPGGGYQPALVVVELMVIAWMLSSVIGVASFEIADQPLVGLVFGGLLGLAVASFLTFYRPFWILGVAGYLYAFNMLGDRATVRVWFMEAER